MKINLDITTVLRNCVVVPLGAIAFFISLPFVLLIATGLIVFYTVSFCLLWLWDRNKAKDWIERKKDNLLRGKEEEDFLKEDQNKK